MNFSWQDTRRISCIYYLSDEEAEWTCLLRFKIELTERTELLSTSNLRLQWSFGFFWPYVNVRFISNRNCLPFVNKWVHPRFIFGVGFPHRFSSLSCFHCRRCVHCAQCCMCLWIVLSWLPLQFSLTLIFQWPFIRMFYSLSLINLLYVLGFNPR